MISIIFFLVILAAIDDHEGLQNGDFLIVLSAFVSENGRTFCHQFFSYLDIIVCIGMAV